MNKEPVKAEVSLRKILGYVLSNYDQGNKTIIVFCDDAKRLKSIIDDVHCSLNFNSVPNKYFKGLKEISIDKNINLIFRVFKGGDSFWDYHGLSVDHVEYCGGTGHKVGAEFKHKMSLLNRKANVINWHHFNIDSVESCIDKYSDMGEAAMRSLVNGSWGLPTIAGKVDHSQVNTVTIQENSKRDNNEYEVKKVYRRKHNKQ